MGQGRTLIGMLAGVAVAAALAGAAFGASGRVAAPADTSGFGSTVPSRTMRVSGPLYVERSSPARGLLARVPCAPGGGSAECYAAR